MALLLVIVHIFIVSLTILLTGSSETCSTLRQRISLNKTGHANIFGSSSTNQVALYQNIVSLDCVFKCQQTNKAVMAIYSREEALCACLNEFVYGDVDRRGEFYAVDLKKKGTNM